MACYVAACVRACVGGPLSENGIHNDNGVPLPVEITTDLSVTATYVRQPVPVQAHYGRREERLQLQYR